MRKIIPLMNNWVFKKPNKQDEIVNLPHTWNNIDGQDGGNDYWRGTCVYKTNFPKPDYDDNTQEVWLEFDGVNSSANVIVNNKTVTSHDGGYSTFRVNITQYLADSNELVVEVDNSVNDKVYPQKADFTFYGGIYRDVKLVVVNKNHFDMDYYGSCGLKITPTVDDGDGICRVESFVTGNGEVLLKLLDADMNIVATGMGRDTKLKVDAVNLWDGVESPYLYTLRATLMVDGQAVDMVEKRVGFRTFFVDSKMGFFLNGKSYPLHGVSRHQDRKALGNAITKAMHDEDMALIKEMGCNTVRLAHYQHDQYFYDLCDEAGMVVWAEIPYISEHLNNGRDNTISQMKELICQNYHHASIVCWGVSNEITISTKDKKDMLDNHHVLNDLCHKMDSTRLTTLACYAMCGPFNKVAHITDLVSWNLYLGWYVPGLKLNDLWLDFFHFVYPNRPLGYSEYGAEAMPNLHSSRPRRNDHTEEYQCVYHEYMLKCFAKRPWMWATHVWNMFDFAADARDQGGEPGMNHKGLVTFDRKIKKDSFYLYKAYWSNEAFVHLCSKRYDKRAEKTTTIKVYSNQPTVSLYCDDQLVATQTADKVFTFKLPLTLSKGCIIKAVAGDCSDEMNICRVATADPAYKLKKKHNQQKSNWV